MRERISREQTDGVLEEQAENLTEPVTHGHIMNGRDVRPKSLLRCLQRDPLQDFLGLLCLSSCKSLGYRPSQSQEVDLTLDNVSDVR